MKVTPPTITSPQGNRNWFKKITLGVLGLGSAAGVTVGYLNLDNRIDGLSSANTQLTQSLNGSEAARTALGEDVGKANATIARLEKDLLDKNTTIQAQSGQITKLESGMTAYGKALEEARVKLTGLETKGKETSDRVGKLTTNLDTVGIKIGGLEKKVSVSDLQDIYNKALSSTVLIEIEIRHKEIEKDDKGKEVEVEKSHTHSGSGYVIAHINGGKDGGYIGTNWHVLECENVKEEDYKNMEIVLHLPGGKKVKARPHLYKDKSGKEELARNKEHDLVLLKTIEDITGTMPVSFASESPKTGEAVMVVGGPFSSDLGYRFSGSFGIVSGDSTVGYGKGNPTIYTSKEEARVKGAIGTVATARTDAAMNPGNSGGLGFRVRDGKMIFMPTFIYPGEIFHGMGFGVTAPIIRDDVKVWIPYDLNADGSFVEKKAEEKKVAPQPPVERPKPGSKQSRIWDRSQNSLLSQSALRQHNGIVSARRTIGV